MSKIGKLVSGIFSLAIIIGCVWAMLNRQLVLDQVRVWQYQPSNDIAALATNAGLSDRGRFQFYAAHPRLESASEFNSECRRAEAASPILGCYKQGEDTIHIYNVADTELDGIKEVTAAHELLHAVWARLPEAEKSRLGRLLESTYERVKDDAFAERMAYYDRAQPGSRVNELHSIIGTEVAEIDSELEAHYRQYFANRNKVVAAHAHYNQKFVNLEAQAKQLKAKLEAQKAVIDQRKDSYETRIAALNQKIAAFNQRAQSGDFSSQEEFRAERAKLQNEGRVLQAERRAIIGLIEQYNSDVETLNGLGEQAERLNQSLDSQKAVE